MRFPMILRSAVLLGLAFFTAASINAQNATCVAPGMLVVTDTKDGSMPASMNIDKVFVAEPLNGDGAQTLTFTLKVASFQAKGSSSLPVGTWNVVFTNVSGLSKYVQMSTLQGSPVFSYGTVSNTVGLPVFVQQGTTPGTYNKSGFITMHVDKTLVGKPSFGTFLNIEARTFLSVPGTGLVLQDTTPSMAYQVVGNSECGHTMQAAFGMSGDVPVANDYTQNGTTDIAIWRPSTGGWFSYDMQSGESTSFTIGGKGDQPVVGNYDNDSRGDNVVYRASTGDWFVHKTESGANAQVHFGTAEDVPVAGDFDGDGVSDIAVFRPSTGTWFVFNSSDQTVSMTAWGSAGDVPVPADYDGDHRSDVAVFRPASGIWFVYNSSDGSATVANFGVATDVAVPADFDGDGKADIAIWRPETGGWYVYASGSGSVTITPWGAANDQPQLGDFNGNGRADYAVWRPSTGEWFVDYN